jgi:hypothetical protein
MAITDATAFTAIVGQVKTALENKKNAKKEAA